MTRPVRYAVVGLGHFGQAAILPAFKNARQNSALTAFVSDDPVKQKKLGNKYDVPLQYRYEQYNELLASGTIDAVYIALPNHMHADFTVRAARAGVHVLCEKPMALYEPEAERMIAACRRHAVKLMIAYRLHLEKTTLEVMDLVRQGRIGKPRFFSSVFSHNVRSGDIRTRAGVGGGALWDIGVYCVNAARNIFREEPREVFAWTANSDPQRFKDVDEIALATLVFRDHKFAQFIVSQAAADTSEYRVVGTRGDIHVEPAYDYSEGLAYKMTVGEKSQKRSYPKRDQIAAELIYFSNCILKNRKPEPSGEEGLADVRIIRALLKSAKSGRPVKIEKSSPDTARPTAEQEISRPPHAMPELVHTQSPSR